MSVSNNTNFINLTKTEEQELSCGICLAIFADPIVTPCCRQTYCDKCIKQWLKSYNTCPHDRSALNENELLPAPRVISNLLNKLQVTCKYRDNGCEESMIFENLEQHIKSCAHNLENICAVCGAKYGNKLFHNCCKNLIERVKSIESANLNLVEQYASLESNYCRVIEENQIKSLEIDKLNKVIEDIKQMVTENKTQAIVSCLRLPQKESTIRLKIGKFSTNTKQYSGTTMVRNMPWRIWCQFDKKREWFAFHLRCEEKTAHQWRVKVSAVLKLISQKQVGFSFSRSFRELFSHEKPEHGFSKFISGINLLDALNGYVMNDSIILEIDFSIETLGSVTY